MNPRTVLVPLLFAALAAARSWADGAAAEPAQKPAAPAPRSAPAKTASPKQDYDAIFSDILKSLPQDKRALVDSAHGAKGVAAPAAGPAEADAARKAAEAKRSQAVQALPPEVKARVDKAISDLDNRRKEKQAEFKELEK